MSEELAKRVEALTGPCRETDAEIYQAVNPHVKPVAGQIGRFFDPAKTTALAAARFVISNGATGYVPRYTASLDAAMTLVPEGAALSCSFYGVNNAVKLTAPGREGIGLALTPALALTAAALRARSAA